MAAGIWFLAFVNFALFAVRAGLAGETQDTLFDQEDSRGPGSLDLLRFLLGLLTVISSVVGIGAMCGGCYHAMKHSTITQAMAIGTGLVSLFLDVVPLGYGIRHLDDTDKQVGLLFTIAVMAIVQFPLLVAYLLCLCRDTPDLPTYKLDNGLNAYRAKHAPAVTTTTSTLASGRSREVVVDGPVRIERETHTRGVVGFRV